MYDFHQTSVNISVHSGTRYTVKISVHTKYGSGRWGQTAVTVTYSDLGPVLNLNARVDDNIEALVHLTWKAPVYKMAVQVITNL